MGIIMKVFGEINGVKVIGTRMSRNRNKVKEVADLLLTGQTYFGSAGASLTHQMTPDISVATAKGFKGEYSTSEALRKWMSGKHPVILIDSVLIENAEGKLNKITGIIEGKDTDHVMIIGNNVILIDSKHYRRSKYFVTENYKIVRGRKTESFAGSNPKDSELADLWGNYLNNHHNTSFSYVLNITTESFVDRSLYWWKAPFRLLTSDKIESFFNDVWESLQDEDFINVDLVADILSCAIEPLDIRTEAIEQVLANEDEDFDKNYEFENDPDGYYGIDYDYGHNNPDNYNEVRTSTYVVIDGHTRETWDVSNKEPEELIEILKGACNVGRLIANNCNITDLSVFACLDKLDTLEVSGNQIIDISPLSNLTSLQSLTLTNNQISDLSPLSGLKSLQVLNIAENKDIFDISPLAGLTNLHYLKMSGNSIFDISPVESLTSLEALCFCNNRVRDITPLEALTNLHELCCIGNNFSKLSPLERLTGLHVLRIGGNRISDVSALAGLIDLCELELRQCIKLDLSQLAKLVNLEKLDIAYCNELTGVAALSGLKKLKQLIYSGKNIPREEILALGRQLPDCKMNDPDNVS